MTKCNQLTPLPFKGLISDLQPWNRNLPQQTVYDRFYRCRPNYCQLNIQLICTFPNVCAEAITRCT